MENAYTVMVQMLLIM